MNDVLQLRGTFQERPSSGRPGSPNIPKKNGEYVTSSHLNALANQLRDLDQSWKSETLISGALIDVTYKTVMAKSNRISGYFNKGRKPNESVVGARFDDANTPNPKHVLTHYITSDMIQDTIENDWLC